MPSENPMQQQSQAQSNSETFSYSRVTTFEQCPRRYRYRYRDGVKEGFRGVEAFMGNCVHEALEWLFLERCADRVRTAAEAVEKYCEVWDRRYTDGGAVVRVIRAGTELEFYRRTGAELIERFHRDRFSVDDRSTVAVEQHFVIELGGRQPFQGFIDRLARDPSGTLHIIDYKTGKRVPRDFRGKEADQLKAYAVAIFARHCEAECSEVVLELDFLRGSKPLRYRMQRSEAAATENELLARIDQVSDSTVFPPVPGILCQWCGFNDLCEGYRPRN